MNNIIDEFDLPLLDYVIPSLDIDIPELHLLPLPVLEYIVVVLPDIEIPTLDLSSVTIFPECIINNAK